MKFNDLADAISAEFNLPAKEAKKLTTFFLTKISDLIEREEELISPVLRMTIRGTKERTLTNEINEMVKNIPAKKIGVISIRKKRS
jgi:hypothetical protein